MRKRLFRCVVCFFCTYGNLHAGEISFINSDISHYKKDSITCEGNVVVVYHDRVISADAIDYNKKTKMIKAWGNVVIKDELKNVYFVDELLVHENFSKGYAKNIKIIMGDKSRLAARCATIKNGIYYLDNVIYSPCYECNESGNITWQLKSQHVIFDPEDVTQYQNVRFEFWGNPILSIPYFAHESFNIKRKSGLLPPKLATSSSNGLTVVVPYLWVISNSQEIILKPLITTKAGTIAWAEYNFRFNQGELNVDTSITNNDSVRHFQIDDAFSQEKIDKINRNKYRGHFFVKLNYDINNIWRAGVDVKLVSDQFYLKRFAFLPYQGRTLETNARLEAFDGDNYTLLKCAGFQTEYFDNIPKILPLIEHNYSRDFLSGTFGINVITMNLEFNKSRSAQKVITNMFWYKDFYLLAGQILQINGVISGKGLDVHEKQHSRYNSECAILPQISCIWNWPLVASYKDFRTIITPIFGVIIAGNSKFHDIFEYPFSELNTLNLFAGNRSISAYDMDSGRRICYGGRVAGYYQGRNIYQFIIGRSTELSNPQNHVETSGLNHKHSNTLLGLDVFILKNITWISRGSYCHHTGNWAKIESDINFKYKKYDFDLIVFSGRHSFYDPFDDNIREKNVGIKKYKGVALSIGYQLTSKVKLLTGFDVGNRVHNDRETNQANNGQCKLIRHKIGMAYKNECTEFNAEIARNRYRSGDLKPETSIRLSIHLKNLGI